MTSYRHDYYDANREKILARRRRYYEANREKCLTSRRKYYKKHRAERIKAMREWKKQHPEANREWRKKNKAHCREYSWKRLGIKCSMSLFNKLLLQQEGCCAICRSTEGHRLHADHNHQTGEVRGLLCRKCNNAIGLLGDNEALCMMAFRYLHGSKK